MRLIITYDISDDTTRRKVFKILEGYGAWKQYSVFELEITRTEKIELTDELKNLIEKGDNIRIYHQCKKCLKKTNEIGQKTKQKEKKKVV